MIGEFLKLHFTRGWVYSIFYFALVFLFTFFYTAVTFDPEAIATNLQKSGAFIPGVRPGAATAEHIAKILTRTTFVGACFLAAVAVLPLADAINYRKPGARYRRYRTPHCCLCCFGFDQKDGRTAFDERVLK